MTDHAQLIAYLKRYTKITPAKMGGKVYLEKIFPSELGRRCRELRAIGVLESYRDRKFVTFRFTPKYAKKYTRTKTDR